MQTSPQFIHVYTRGRGRITQSLSKSSNIHSTCIDTTGAGSGGIGRPFWSFFFTSSSSSSSSLFSRFFPFFLILASLFFCIALHDVAFFSDCVVCLPPPLPGSFRTVEEEEEEHVVIHAHGTHTRTHTQYIEVIQSVVG